MIARIIFVLLLFFSCDVHAARRFVDATLSANCTSGNYSIANRTCTGSDGYGYQTIAASFAAATPGDHHILRGGTYTGTFTIPLALNITTNGSWTEGHYNSIASCSTLDGCASNEWAILDGNYANGTDHAVLGNFSYTGNGSADLKWWKIERLEIKNGRDTPTGSSGWGFAGNGGPFWITKCYFHDNKGDPALGGSQCDNLPAGTFGYAPHDSIVEFNYFANNGGTAQNNCKQIAWDISYALTDNIQRNGLTIPNYATGGYMSSFGDAVDVRNTIRYNLVDGGVVGIAMKHFSYLTGRDTTNAPYSDTYKDAGVKIHHNIVRPAAGTDGYAIGAHQDFAQVYNNIIDGGGFGIRAQYDYWNSNVYGFHYKVSAYNNTVLNTKSAYAGYGSKYNTWSDNRVFVYLHNNLMDNVSSNADYALEGGITPKMRSASENTLDYANAYISHNYAYRPNGTVHYDIDRTSYTTATFEAQTVTPTPRVGYTNSYNAGNLLYQGTTGADKYIPRTAHTVESGVTMANGGIGTAHPYLSGVTLPAYLGAVNPADSSWVGGLLALSNPNTLRDMLSDPAWIEGGSGGDTTAPTVTIATGDPSTISTNSLSVTGSASDTVGVSGCKWRIGSAPDALNGTACSGTTSFSCTTTGYASGANTLYVGCSDSAGNYGSDTISVNYTPTATSSLGSVLLGVQ